MSSESVGRWTVLVNSEGQHGLFPASRPAPGGWRATGMTGTEDECVAYVDAHWTDLRPESLRLAMADAGSRGRQL